jgi:hypothetical protein
MTAFHAVPGFLPRRIASATSVFSKKSKDGRSIRDREEVILPLITISHTKGLFMKSCVRVSQAPLSRPIQPARPFRSRSPVA